MNFQYTGQQQEGTVEQIENSIGKYVAHMRSDIDRIIIIFDRF